MLIEKCEKPHGYIAVRGKYTFHFVESQPEFFFILGAKWHFLS